MKDLTELGRYLEILVQKSHGGNFAAAAKDIGVSSTELHSLRYGKRDNPNPGILKKIAAELDGDYYILFELAGYSPPIRPEVPVVALPIIGGNPPESVGKLDCPVSWLQPGDRARGYYWYQDGPRLALVRLSTTWEDGEVVLIPGGSMYRAYRLHDCIELLDIMGPVIRRKTVSEIEIRGVVERVVVPLGKEGEW